MTGDQLYSCTIDAGHAVACHPVGPASVPWTDALHWAGAGAFAVLVLGAVIVCVVDRETREMLIGFTIAALSGPFLLVLHGLRKLGLFGGVPLDARALERFSRAKHRGGGRAFALFYTPRLGVIWVRGLRDNKPVPPIRIRSTADPARRATPTEGSP